MMNILYQHCDGWVTVLWTVCCMTGSSVLQQICRIKSFISAGVSWTEEGKGPLWILSIKIHTTKKQFIKVHHYNLLSSTAQGKTSVLWHYQVNNGCPSNGMTDVSDDEFGLVTCLLVVWKMRWGNPWEVVLSQTNTGAWGCGNDSQYSQTNLSSCQGPTESVKLHQQVQHRKCDTNTDTHA